MLGRIGGTAVALGLIAVLAQTLAQERIEPALESQPESSRGQQDSGPASQQDAAPEQQSASELLAAIQGIEAAIRDLVSKEDEEARQRQEEREKSDLKAQEKMARWTFWMFIAALASVLLTAVAVFLIWRTLRHTKKAADAAVDAVSETRNATVAAEQAVEDTRDVGIRQIRAYVAMSSAVIGNFATNSKPIVTIGIRNTGKSPADTLRLAVQVNMNIPAKALRIKFPYPRQNKVSVTTLSPGMTVKQDFPFPITLTDNDIVAVRKEEKIIVIGGYITYRDVFLKRRRTILKMILDVGSLREGKGAFSPYRKGNHMT